MTPPLNRTTSMKPAAALTVLKKEYRRVMEIKQSDGKNGIRSSVCFIDQVEFGWLILSLLVG